VTDAEVLRYAGVLGHTYAVIVEYPDGALSIGLETCRKPLPSDAQSWPSARRVQAYRRTLSGTWAKCGRLR
jgi:hypothetical protein